MGVGIALYKLMKVWAGPAKGVPTRTKGIM